MAEVEVRAAIAELEQEQEIDELKAGIGVIEVELMRDEELDEDTKNMRSATSRRIFNQDKLIGESNEICVVSPSTRRVNGGLRAGVQEDGRGCWIRSFRFSALLGLSPSNPISQGPFGLVPRPSRHGPNNRSIVSSLFNLTPQHRAGPMTVV